MHCCISMLKRKTKYSWSCLKTSAVYVFVLKMAYVSKKEYPGVRFGSKKDTRVARARKGMFGVLAPRALQPYSIMGYKAGREGWAKRKGAKDSVFGGAPCMWRVCVILHPALEYRLLFTGACEPPKHLSQCLTSRNRPPPLSLTSTLRKVSLQLIILGCSSSAHYDILLERHRYPWIQVIHNQV